VPVSRAAGSWWAGAGVVHGVGSVVPGRRPGAVPRGRRVVAARPVGGGGVNAVTGSGVVWAVREVEAQLRLGHEVATVTLRWLVEQDLSRPCLRDPEAWFPVQETPELAGSLCGGCAVRELCLELALRRREYGIWGGTTTQDRERRMRRDRRGRRAEMTAAADDGTAA
jgi:hypothetical protein